MFKLVRVPEVSINNSKPFPNQDSFGDSSVTDVDRGRVCFCDSNFGTFAMFPWWPQAYCDDMAWWVLAWVPISTFGESLVEIRNFMYRLHRWSRRRCFCFCYSACFFSILSLSCLQNILMGMRTFGRSKTRPCSGCPIAETALVLC